MKKDKEIVGLATLFRSNFGSILQCYATITALKKMGYEVSLLEFDYKKSTFLQKLAKLFKMLRYRNYLVDRKKAFSAMTSEAQYLSPTSAGILDNFVKKELKPNLYSWNELKRIDSTGKFKCFITGSDQVWNPGPSLSPFFFLRFTEKRKRIAFSVSFGVSEVPEYNIHTIKKWLNGFESLSLREETGVNIVNKYCNIHTVRTADPVLLLNKEEWCKFAYNYNSAYIFVHFLNEPNELAIRCINSIADKEVMPIICFAYNHISYKKLKNATFIDGGPNEYVGGINSARVVLTDSFHTTMFSILLNTQFLTFERQYLHDKPQNSRIVDLLKRYSLLSRLIINEQQDIYLPIDFSDKNQLTEFEKNNALNYLKSELLNINNR